MTDLEPIAWQYVTTDGGTGVTLHPKRRQRLEDQGAIIRPLFAASPLMTNPETSSDLVERLKAGAIVFAGKDLPYASDAMSQAATTIERLTAAASPLNAIIAASALEQAAAEIERLSALNARQAEALKKIVSCHDRNWQHQREKLDDIIPLARAALATESSNGQ